MPGDELPGVAPESVHEPVQLNGLLGLKMPKNGVILNLELIRILPDVSLNSTIFLKSKKYPNNDFLGTGLGIW